MLLSRRRALQALATLTAAAAAPVAEAATTDLVLNGDPTLVPALSAAAERFYRVSGAMVRIFPTGPGLLVPQLVRRVQNDLICTERATMEAALAAQLVAGRPRGAWRSPLVIAARRGAGKAALAGRIAVTDPTPASDMDGPAVLGALSLNPKAVRGVVDTDEIAFLLARGEVEAGLLRTSDLGPDLEVVMTIPETIARPPVYAIAVTILARRPKPEAFADFLLSPEGGAILKSHGLENLA